jgi:hypothetical protein
LNNIARKLENKLNEFFWSIIEYSSTSLIL